MHEKIQRFSLRKLSVGLASVMVGACIFSINGKTVKADVTSDQTTQTTNVQGQTAITQAQSNDVQSEKKQTSSDQNSVAEQSQKNLLDDLSKQKTSAQSGDQAEAKNQENRLVDQINYKLTNNTSTDNKKDLGRNLTAPDETKSTSTTKSDAEKSIVSPSSAQQTNNQSNDHADDNPQTQPQIEQKLDLTKNSKKFAKKVLATNLIETNSSPMTNGGFDEATWGKLDVNDWKGSVQGDYYQLTDYTGDANHVIVPNEADFAKAGISTSGKQVGVTSSLMSTIFKNKATAQDATVAFSKTDNKMVKAIDTNWSNTWGHEYSNDSKAQLSKFDGTNLDVSNVTNMTNTFYGNQIGDLSPLANWKVDKVTDMSGMFVGNQISDLNPLAGWHTDNITDMSHMFAKNQISDLSPLAGWHTDNITDMSHMFANNQISDLSPLANWKVANVTNMGWLFSGNYISDLSPLANWHTDKVTNMWNMFSSNQISDLSPLANWKVDQVTDLHGMFVNNQISDLSPLANWKVDQVTNMSSMFVNNQISDLSPLANWKVDNVIDMSDMFSSNQISDLSPLANWKVDNVIDMRDMFSSNQISDLSPLANWTVSNVINMDSMLRGNKITDLSPLTNWKTDKVTNMEWMFGNNYISDLSPLSNWNTGKVTDMSCMFGYNQISDLSPLASWKTDNVTNMRWMFLHNYSTQTKNLQAKRVIGFVYPDGYTGKKQDSVTQTLDVPQKVQVKLVTKDSKPSNNILDWVSKIETPEAPDPVYFQDYTVPTVSNLVPSISTVAKQEADPNKPINVTVTYTASPVTVHFKDVDENADKDSNAVKQELGKTVQLSGTYGSEVDLNNVKLPANFVIADTSSNTFGNTTDAYIHLKHQHAKSVTQAPATRTIVVHMPDGTTKTYVQLIVFVNNLDKDLVTNKTTNIYTVDASKSNVTVDGQPSTQYQAYVLKDGVVNYAPIKLPHINGYKVKLIQDKANPAMFMVSFVALPQQNNQSNNVQSPQKPAQAKQNQPEPIQTIPAKQEQEDKQIDQLVRTISYTLMNDSSDTADSFEPTQADSDSFEAPSDSTQKDDAAKPQKVNAAKPQKVNAAKHKKHIVKKHVVKRHKKHAKKYHLKRHSRKHTKRAKKRIIKHRKSVSRKFRKHNLKHVKKN